MNNEYLAKAREKVPDAKTLIVLASKRARLLATGAPPMVRCKDENFLDVALLEIAEGKLVASNTPLRSTISARFILISKAYVLDGAFLKCSSTVLFNIVTSISLMAMTLNALKNKNIVHSNLFLPLSRLSVLFLSAKLIRSGRGISCPGL